MARFWDGRTAVTGHITRPMSVGAALTGSLRAPSAGPRGIRGSAGLLPLVCLKSRPLGVARRRVVASLRGGRGGVGPDVGEHAAAVPAREGPHEP
jgi:hypothetical protein